jgi:hypothetical protein
MLDLLVNSKSKLKFLRLLWVQELSGSVSELSRLAEVGFATAYDGLKALEKEGFVKSEFVGNAKVYSANANFEFSELLLKLLSSKPLEDSIQKSSQFLDVSDSDVELNLSHHGAPLGASGQPQKALSLEEAVAKGLELSHRNATVVRSLPVLLFKRRGELNMPMLEYLADRLDEKQTLGFFLDLSGQLGNDSRLKRLASQFRDRRFSKMHDFFLTSQGRFERQLAEMNTPPVAKKWHFRLNMEMDTFKTLFDKFCDAY